MLWGRWERGWDGGGGRREGRWKKGEGKGDFYNKTVSMCIVCNCLQGNYFSTAKPTVLIHAMVVITAAIWGGETAKPMLGAKT